MASEYAKKQWLEQVCIFISSFISLYSYFWIFLFFIFWNFSGFFFCGIEGDFFDLFHFILSLCIYEELVDFSKYSTAFFIKILEYFRTQLAYMHHRANAPFPSFSQANQPNSFNFSNFTRFHRPQQGFHPAYPYHQPNFYH